MARADSSVIISRFRPRVNPFFNLFLTLFDSFSSKSGFSRDKSCIFLDIAEKMQSLSLLRLIEKFAEIHRQVSLRSLTTISWQAFICFSRLNPFQLQNALHSALKLHFFKEWGDVRAADPGNSHRGAVLCLRQTRPLRERASAPCDFRFPSR